MSEAHDTLDAKDEQFFFEEQGKPFIRHDELKALQRRYEIQQAEAVRVGCA
ncbi:hypothetical protein [Enterobacter kobei]|uniref:hypothetical protein n=1 Tax=Enterobacter kobei TaxID=208224 RepID=UPI001C3C8129|nr:hypothetical protein [Enterobacter kobei]